MIRISTIFLTLLLAGGCQEAQQPSTATPPSETAQSDAEQIDASRYIRASALLERIENETGHFVFDVRSRASYAESHIEDAMSMPYGKFEQQDIAALSQMTLDTPIVTYCGCPHHLAGLAADQLIEWGYRNVRVLYEGYWFWRDNQYPVAGAQIQAATELHFAGRISSDGEPLSHTNVFIRSSRNGQLEAAVTDAAGNFETAFHVLGYRVDDQFELRVGSLDGPARSIRPLNRQDIYSL